VAHVVIVPQARTSLEQLNDRRSAWRARSRWEDIRKAAQAHITRRMVRPMVTQMTLNATEEAHLRSEITGLLLPDPDPRWRRQRTISSDERTDVLAHLIHEYRLRPQLGRWVLGPNSANFTGAARPHSIPSSRYDPKVGNVCPQSCAYVPYWDTRRR
jgi:hypothetical protein